MQPPSTFACVRDWNIVDLCGVLKALRIHWQQVSKSLCWWFYYCPSVPNQMILTKPHQVKEEKKMQENFLYKINMSSTKKRMRVYIWCGCIYWTKTGTGSMHSRDKKETQIRSHEYWLPIHNFSQNRTQYECESHGCSRASLAVGRLRGLSSSKSLTKSMNPTSETCRWCSSEDSSGIRYSTWFVSWTLQARYE